MKATDVDYRNLNEESAIELENGKKTQRKQGELDTSYLSLDKSFIM
jgi:hypothetical protein